MWQRFKDGFRNFMLGRHGSDQFSLFLLVLGIVLWVVAMITRISIFGYIETALYIYAIFRMFSKNNPKRDAENIAFMNIWTKVTTGTRQAFNRAKNSGKYKYFVCPQCKCRLRLPRKVGEVTVTCAKCGHKFKKKA